MRDMCTIPAGGGETGIQVQQHAQQRKVHGGDQKKTGDDVRLSHAVENNRRSSGRKTYL
jgi:hypothetical protein